MTNYGEYKKTLDAINGVLKNKEEEIKDIEEEMRNLKSTRRMLDEEFKTRIAKKPWEIG